MDIEDKAPKQPEIKAKRKKQPEMKVFFHNPNPEKTEERVKALFLKIHKK